MNVLLILLSTKTYPVVTDLSWTVSPELCTFTSISWLPGGHGLKALPFGSLLSKDLSAQTWDSCGFSVILHAQDNLFRETKILFVFVGKLFTQFLLNCRISFKILEVWFGDGFLSFLLSRRVTVSRRKAGMGSVLTEDLGRGLFLQKGRSPRITLFPLGYHFSLGKTGTIYPHKDGKETVRVWSTGKRRWGMLTAYKKRFKTMTIFIDDLMQSPVTLPGYIPACFGILSLSSCSWTVRRDAGLWSTHEGYFLLKFW